MVGWRIARSQSVAIAGVVDGHLVCPRATDSHHLAAGRRNQHRLYRRLLLPGRPGTQDRIGGHTAFGIAAAESAAGRSDLGGDRRFPDQALWAEGRGADIHHNPTPGPADQAYLYGHIWVTLSLAVRHPRWGALALPLRALLYVRQNTIAKIPRKRGWTFATKLVLAARLVEWIAPLVQQAGKTLWIVVDGGYTKAVFLQRAAAAGVTIVGRLRKDAALRDLPPQLKRGQRARRGRPRKYGKNKIRLGKRAAHKQGWEKITCTIYGKTTTKTCKTFLATYRPAGGVIRVVLIREERGWLALFCTDPGASVQEIIEAFADRATIEQDFHDVKEVWGAGQQQVRNIWTNVAVYHLNLWIHTLVELWAWNRPHEELCDRSDSPWDDAARRPSQANRRKALCEQIMKTELSTITTTWKLPRKILQLTERLMAIAA